MTNINFDSQAYLENMMNRVACPDCHADRTGVNKPCEAGKECPAPVSVEFLIDNVIQAPSRSGKESK